ncbi:MAG: nucleotide sugar dehydrogenase [Methanomicrobiales archaeon HGW-Methanomicrobiales-1]|jgi:UDPglucose 6-dehydrogenase/UDP-N-acetyl-D-galactosamine dehydrogenase|nr:MAG: nucleotide sugar dehydrogenase [Methanomicrobiales archaeon HGW-Methanomicrobiales-1]
MVSGQDDKVTVCVIGLGYVGYPLAEAFSQHVETIGFDIDRNKIDQIQKSGSKIHATSNPEEIHNADYILICVPTPVTKNKQPDLSPVRGAVEIAGRHLKKGATVVLESTVYPGVTEEIVLPILEKESGMKCGEGFRIGYSPERINPGDDAHELAKIIKIVAGMDNETLDDLAILYGNVTTVYRARSIQVAEAAKVIENIQRDLNIALMNELTVIFHRLGINTADVLEAAGTKWNFMHFTPGLVGGHCIPVDPYYLVARAQEYGYHPQVILAGRSINDSMPKYVADMAVKGLNNAGKVIKGSSVLIMGLTYKENVPDTRESPVEEMVKELKEFGVHVYGYDPLLPDSIIQKFGAIPLPELDRKVDAIIVAVAHNAFRTMNIDYIHNLMNAHPLLVDVRGMIAKTTAEENGITYYRL